MARHNISKRGAGSKEKLRRSGAQMMGGRFKQLAWIENSQDRRHFGKCKKQSRCPWCNYILCKDKWKDKLTMLPNPSPKELARLPAAARTLAKSSWLDRKIVDNDGSTVIRMGCAACAEHFKNTPNGNNWAHYEVEIPAARMRPARFTPHACTRQRRIAVASLLQLETGLQMMTCVSREQWVKSPVSGLERSEADASVLASVLARQSYCCTCVAPARPEDPRGTSPSTHPHLSTSRRCGTPLGAGCALALALQAWGGRRKPRSSSFAWAKPSGRKISPS